MIIYTYYINNRSDEIITIDNQNKFSEDNLSKEKKEEIKKNSKEEENLDLTIEKHYKNNNLVYIKA